jgi:hypothetical protein
MRLKKRVEVERSEPSGVLKTVDQRTNAINKVYREKK